MTPAPIIAAAPTPFDDSLAIDEPAFRTMLSGLPAEHRTVLVAGTTGEFPALDRDERARLFRIAADQVGPDQVIAHVGAASLLEAVALSESAAAAGIGRVALLTPYYLPADAGQVIDFFGDFTGRTPGLTTYAYLFPERTGVTVDPATFATVAALPNLRGVKLSGSANERFADYRAALAPGQELYTGDDRRLLAVASQGGTGVISGCFAALPAPFLPALDAPTQPSAGQASIDRAVDVLGRSIAHQKAALRRRTGRPWRSRMSVPAVTPDQLHAVHALVDQPLG